MINFTLFLFKTNWCLQTIYLHKIRMQRDTSKPLCQERFKKIAGQGPMMGKFGQTITSIVVTKIKSWIHTAHWTVVFALQDANMKIHSHIRHCILKQMAQQLGSFSQKYIQPSWARRNYKLTITEILQKVFLAWKVQLHFNVYSKRCNLSRF